MKAFVESPPTLSQAMFRVAAALRATAPDGVECVVDRKTADVEVLHVVGYEALEQAGRSDVAVIQYCHASASTGAQGPWAPLWGPARAVWSYYDLSRQMPAGARFYLAPLGVDGACFEPGTAPRDVGVMTSGYVTGPGAEAIEEVAIAAERACLTVRHLGPIPVGLSSPLGENWSAFNGVDDWELAAEYRRCRWVSGLRHVEGFELPVIEGLASGCRPIVFDRPDMRRWYDGHAVFVPELEGAPLVDALTRILRTEPKPVSKRERAKVLARFDWHRVCGGFWKALSEEKEAAA